ncbi:14857_t:CDS:1 [Acaulospora colombiana]|uniref:14857_t:CDS:1 n=2 Tax=Acaulospora colombiana TaxID=27376 RepID=A0ACA9LQY7_9GLOM|nr:14855_t:CDS:1 [Acaulospora colombiana]CAG8545794.1 14857_t:CDS:1 [Acaulospora colombiana]
MKEGNFELLQYPFEKSPNAQWLRSRVRILNYTIHKTSGLFPSGIDWEAGLAPTLCWFPQLYELRLGVDNTHKLDSKTIAALQDTPSIHALQIAMRMDRAGGKPITSQVPYQLLGISAWKLEFLVIRGDKFDLKALNQYPPVTHQLVEFRWTVQGCDMILDGPDVEKLITWVTSNSMRTLENLYLPSVHPIARKLANTIRSLTIPTLMESPNDFRSLQELILTEKTEMPTESQYYIALPPNLMHFGMKVHSAAVHGNTETVAWHFNPKLKIFSIYHDSWTATKTRLEQNSWKAAGGAVLVRTFGGEHSTQIGMRSDLVQSHAYPRGVTIENMHKGSRVVGLDHTEEPSPQNSNLLFDLGNTIIKHLGGSMAPRGM